MTLTAAIVRKLFRIFFNKKIKKIKRISNLYNMIPIMQYHNIKYIW